MSPGRTRRPWSHRPTGSGLPLRPGSRAKIRLIENIAPAPATGDPRLLETLADNLIDNAIRHNYSGGYAEIATATIGSQATLTISNSGPVIPESQLQRLFQPFQRFEPERNGHRDGYGIGLAIADAITRAHHATLTARAQPEGGLRITACFTNTPHAELLEVLIAQVVTAADTR